MSLTDQQRAERQSYLGATDMAALLGLNPPKWSQPIDVFAEKRPDIIPPRPRTATPMLDLGHVLEEPVARLFVAHTDLPVRRLPGWDSAAGPRPVRNPARPWEGANPDRMVVGGGPLDCKLSMRHQDEWGATDGTGNGRVPARYNAQVQWQMHLTNRDHGYLAVLLGYGRFEWYRLDRDDDLLSTMVELADLFWHDNVLAGVPPEPDGSQSYDQLLRARLAQSEDRELVATPYQQALLAERRTAMDQQDAAARAMAVADQKLQASMGTAAVLVAPDARVSWKTSKPRTTYDWEAVAWDGWYVAMGEQATSDAQQIEWTAMQMSDSADEHRVIGNPSRPWRVTYSDEGE